MNISSDLINISSQPFPKRQILDPWKLRVLQITISILSRKRQKVFQMVRKHCRKRFILQTHIKQGLVSERVKHLWNTMIYKIGQTFCFANWVQNKGSLSMYCIALGAFIRRNTVPSNIFRNFHHQGCWLIGSCCKEWNNKHYTIPNFQRNTKIPYSFIEKKIYVRLNNEEKEESPGDQPFLHFPNCSLYDQNSIFDQCSVGSLQLLPALTILRICFL